MCLRCSIKRSYVYRFSMLEQQTSSSGMHEYLLTNPLCCQLSLQPISPAFTSWPLFKVKLFLRKIIFVRWTCRSYLFSNDLLVTDAWFYLSQWKAWIPIKPTDFSRRQRQWERTHFIYLDAGVWAMLWYIALKSFNETETRTFVLKAPESVLPRLVQLNPYYPMGLASKLTGSTSHL